MKKNILIICLLTTISLKTNAQTITENGKILSEKETKEILKQISPDSTKLLKDYGDVACKCIDSISLSNKSRDEAVIAINKCIDEQTFLYQSMAKMAASLKNIDPNNKTITINTNKNSEDYKKYYYQLEQWLKDSCKALNRAINSENKHSANSMSENEDALAAYNSGTTILRNDDYAKALPFFKKAVEIDPNFAFAWDNLGICNRKLGNLDKALEAYQKSVTIDPTGKTPLQNIPIVYLYKKEYDKAIDAYQNLLAVSPNDAEVFYGIGNVFFSGKNDMEKALEYMCKAYNIYTQQKSPYRVDAQKIINMIYTKLKADNKEDLFYKILKDNNIDVNKNKL